MKRMLLLCVLLMFPLIACKEPSAKEQLEEKMARKMLDRIEEQESDMEKQKRTIEDMKKISTAICLYQVDHDAFPVTDDAMEGLAEILVPKYIEEVPLLDHWGRSYLYSGTKESFNLSSGGKDGGPVHSTDNNFDKLDFDHPITIMNGLFSAAPARD